MLPFCAAACRNFVHCRAKQEEADLGEVQHFALKALAKKAVVDRGQLAHVKDEKLLLQNMSHPLILGLYSTFQVRSGLLRFSRVPDDSCDQQRGSIPTCVEGIPQSDRIASRTSSPAYIFYGTL